MKDKKVYKLVEVYNSVKGEGTQAGMPMTFVRFSKCNLACSWCDTPYAQVAIELEREKLIHHIREQEPAWVVFTGGEPMLQLDEELILGVRSSGIKMAIETNGILYEEGVIKRLDYINISPKRGQPINGEYVHTRVHEIRYTLTAEDRDIWAPFSSDGVPPLPTGLHQHSPLGLLGLPADYITISPVFDDIHPPPPGWKSGDGYVRETGAINRASLAICQGLVQKYRHYGARLSLQVHKFIGVR